MCEECESLETPLASYAEKRKLIRATWRPPGRAGRSFAAEPVATGSSLVAPQSANANEK